MKYCEIAEQERISEGTFKFNLLTSDNFMKKTLIILFVFGFYVTNAQQPDSVSQKAGISFQEEKINLSDSLYKINQNKLTLKSLILPTTFIAYGFVALNNNELLKLDQSIKEEIWTDRPHRPITVDNYLQYAPAAAVYALNVMGIKGKNNLKDQTMIYLMSNAIMGVTVQSIKAITKIQRPDGYGTNAFPSGHTATAFVSAEFLYREYKDISPWYGIAGYAAATTTAYLRMYNNKHWFRDLLPGAGIGIISTHLAYWVYPSIKKKLFKDKPMNAMVMPFYQKGGGGLSLAYNFRH